MSVKFLFYFHVDDFRLSDSASKVTNQIKTNLAKKLQYIRFGIFSLHQTKPMQNWKSIFRVMSSSSCDSIFKLKKLSLNYGLEFEYS